MLLFKKPQAARPSCARSWLLIEHTRLRRRSIMFPELLGGGAPHFREVPAWDAHYHVQHLSLPAGASYGDLLRLVADLHEPMLDRDRPLFRCWVIDRVPGGMFALYTKTHRAVIDGASGMKALYAGLSDVYRRAIGKPGFALGAPAATPRPRAPVAKRIADSIRLGTAACKPVALVRTFFGRSSHLVLYSPPRQQQVRLGRASSESD